MNMTILCLNRGTSLTATAIRRVAAVLDKYKADRLQNHLSKWFHFNFISIRSELNESHE